MEKKGFMITIMGEKFVRKVEFYENKPSKQKLDELLEYYQGVKIFVTPTEVYSK